MAVTKDEVLDSLESVKSPEGTPLPKTGTLSDIVVTDGKVFFSITVDAAVVDRLGAGAQGAPRPRCAPCPGVVSVMVALTAERRRA